MAGKRVRSEEDCIVHNYADQEFSEAVDHSN